MEELAGEASWVRKFQAGDPSAFVAIMNHYEPYILGLLHRMTGDRARAEDLCQETFLKALKGLNRFRSDSSLKTWLFRIAHNAFMDASRVVDPNASSLDELGEKGIEPREPTPCAMSQIQEDQVRRAVEAAMVGLPRAQREVLHLFYWDDLSVAEIAQALRSPEGTVKTHLSRGRQALRGKVIHLLPEVTG